MTHDFSELLSVHEAGDPQLRTAFILHGGGGPRTVAPIVAHLASTMHTHAPTHPGFDGTSRPESTSSVAELAASYLAYLHDRGHADVVLIGSSLGGWIALEMALQARADQRFAGLIGAVIDIDGVGVLVEGEPIADFFALNPRELAAIAWHNPDRGFIDPTQLTEAQRDAAQANARTMAVLAGTGMNDSTLLERVGAISVPTLVVWGESDRVVTPEYGRAIARSIPGARFTEIAEAGHLPQLEAPEATWAAIDSFLG